MDKIKEAQASLSYYGFKRMPEEDFGDDGTRFFMWVWDPEDTGKSPFKFSKAGGYGEVFFSFHSSSRLDSLCYSHGYTDLDKLNGVDKSKFTDEAVGHIVKELQEIRDSEWFAKEYPDFATKTAIDNGIETKVYTADKDHQRVMDIAKRANSDPIKMEKLAANMAKAIGDKEKMRSRWQAAVDIYGEDSPVAKAFELQAKSRSWFLNIKPRSGNIDWSSLFESTLQGLDDVSEEEAYNIIFDFCSYLEWKYEENDCTVLGRSKSDDNLYLIDTVDKQYVFDVMNGKVVPNAKIVENTEYWNNFFDKLTEDVSKDKITESVDEDDAIGRALEEYFGQEAYEADEDVYGMSSYEVDGETYIVGDSDTAYEAAVSTAENNFETSYTDSDKVDWLQKWNWPGIDEEEVCAALGDDPDDYDEGETIYQPDTIDEYISMMGYEKASDALSWDFLRSYVNTREVGEFVVDTDGIANSLATYNGKEIELNDGLLAYRIR